MNEQEWRCSHCGKLLGIVCEGRLHLRFARGHEYLVGFPATSVCRSCRTLGVTIANGDEVGVLVPEDLEPVAKAAGEEAEDLHRTVIAALLAQVPEDEISLNAAARRLAWSGHTRFERYRETDDKGNQRASRPFREMIMAACQRSLTMVAGAMSRGFTCDTRRKPITLKRFELPASATDLASEEPEFMEDA